MSDEVAEEGYHPLDLVVEQKKRISSLEEENRRMREALENVLAWKDAVDMIAPQLGGLLMAMYHARAALSQEEKP